MSTNALRQLRHSDLPSLFREADRCSVRGQQRFIRATKARLLLAVLAAVCASFAYIAKVGHVELLSIGAAAAFTAAFGSEVWLLAARPEQDWYGGRALAESAKTLSWRYAVCGLPFPLDQASADVYLAEQLAELLVDAPDLPVLPGHEVALPPALSAWRGQPLDDRRKAYIEGRIEDQQRWYAEKAEANAARANWWRLGLIGTELAGAVVAMLTALSVLHVDLTSIASTVVGVGAAWLAVRQHEAVARAYTIASHELVLIAVRLERVSDEHSWAAEVADAEEAISREHTMWRASRAVHGTVGPTTVGRPRTHPDTP